MPKAINRIVALILVLCLVADSTSAEVVSQNWTIPNRAIRSSHIDLFDQEVLSAEPLFQDTEVFPEPSAEAKRETARSVRGDPAKERVHKEEVWRTTLDRARHYIARREGNEAIRILRPAVEEDSHNYELQEFYTEALITARRSSEALFHAQRASELNPTSAHAQKLWAIACRFTGDYAGAIAHRQEQLRLDPDDPQATQEIQGYFRGWIKTLRDQNQYGELDRILRTYVESCPTDVVAHAMLGERLLHKGDYDGCVREFVEVLKELPNDFRAHWRMAQVYFAGGDLAKVKEHLDMADRARPGHPAVQSFRLEYIEGLSRSGQLAKALQEAQAAAKENPQDLDLARLKAHLGEILFGPSDSTLPSWRLLQILASRAARFMHRNQMAEALLVLERAEQLNPQDLEVLCLRALMLPPIGRTQEAVARLHEIIKAHPNYPRAYDTLAEILSQSGDVQGALGVVEKGRSRQPGNIFLRFNTNCCSTAPRV